MPTAGGGPPRKSHTKSRKGCRTCKKRHIRCDESFPQCRNCTKHSVRCDYMDMPTAGEEPLKGSKPPDLMMSTELQQTLDKWRLTGEPPLPELTANDAIYWTRFSTIDLRLVHHITTLSLDLNRSGYSSCTSWGSRMPSLINVALSSDFTMSALLALSASQLAWQTKNQDTENLAYHHWGVALKGLHEAIGTFSERNSEAILATSILLSWQATDWRSWASLQQGLSTIMKVMRPWMHKSELAVFLESQRSIMRARTPSTPSLSGRTSQSLPQEDLSRLEQISGALQTLRLRLSNHEELVQHVDDLMGYLRQLKQDLPLQAPEAAFERLQHLRGLLFWLPPSLLRLGESDLGAVAMLSHFYALALAVEPLFPEIEGAYLGNMSLVPIEKMHEMLRSRRLSIPHDHSLQIALSLMDTPVQIAASYRQQRVAMSLSRDSYPGSTSSGHRSPFAHPGLSFANPDFARPGTYSRSPMHSPQGVLPSTSYFPSMASPGSVSQDMGPAQPSMGSRRSTGSTMSNLSYPQPGSGSLSSGVPTADYFGQAQAQAQAQVRPQASYSPSHYGSVGGMSSIQNRQVNVSPPLAAASSVHPPTPPILRSNASRAEGLGYRPPGGKWMP